MARITLSNLAHSYLPNPTSEDDYALKEMDHVWNDGEAYALLGSSGCGKSTLLNIISGLLHPSQGRILFGDTDVTDAPTAERNIAQVFQFPVVYDTMTVRDNLAFPLRNRGAEAAYVASRVQEIARMIGMEETLDRKAKGLTADAKQKISLGRGMVREDVNAILFDEPLTVIDPHMKWELRTQLKALHHQFGHTMIYVTHDQTEAMTLADEIVVLRDGRVEQVGSPMALYNDPANRFVAGFLGAPSMNFLPAERVGGPAGHSVGIRPEHLRIVPAGRLGGTVTHVEKLGGDTNVLVDVGGEIVTVRLFGQHEIAPDQSVQLEYDEADQFLFDAAGGRVRQAAPAAA